MGWDLALHVGDQSIAEPQLSRSFLYDIVWGSLYRPETILTEEEAEILEPNTLGEVVVGQKNTLTSREWYRLLNDAKGPVPGAEGGFGDPGAVFDHVLNISQAVKDRERDPGPLKKVLKKLERYLIDHAADLPLVHLVYRDPARTMSVGYVMIDGHRYQIFGDLSGTYSREAYPAKRNKLLLQAVHSPPGGQRLVEVTPQMTFDGVVVYTRTLTTAAYYADQFQASYDFLDKAASQGKRVLWEYF